MKSSRVKLVLAIALLFAISLASRGDKGKETKVEGSVVEQEESPIGTYKVRNITANLQKSPEYKKPAEGDPVEVVYEFFELNESLFHIPNPRCELTPTRNILEHYRPLVSFQQIYNGIPIQQTDITARFTYSGGLISIEGEYLYDINLPVIPPIDSAFAVKLSLRAMGSPPHPRVVAPANPIIILGEHIPRHNTPVPVSHGTPHSILNDRLYMVWILEIFPESSRPRGRFERFYMDALKGSILHRETSTTFRE